MKKILYFFLAVGLMVGVVSLSGIISESTYASACTDHTFLGMKAWYNGLECGSDGNAPQPTDRSQEAMKTFVWTIVGNIAYDVLIIVGIIATGFVIYAGYAYITAGGDPGKAAKAKKSLIGSIAGILLSISASSIIDVIIHAIGAKSNQKTSDTAATVATTLNGAFNLALSFAGVVAVGFIILSGISYMTSGGNPAKVQKARQTLIYSVVGLIIVIASYAIVNFVLSGGSE